MDVAHEIDMAHEIEMAHEIDMAHSWTSVICDYVSTDMKR